MVDGISAALPALTTLEPSASTAPTQLGDPESSGFAHDLGSAVERVDAAQDFADGALTLLASGEQVDLHGTMIALEQAEISLRAMVSVRNRVVAAYESVMNMAI